MQLPHMPNSSLQVVFVHCHRRSKQELKGLQHCQATLQAVKQVELACQRYLHPPISADHQVASPQEVTMELKGLQRRQKALQVGAAAYSHQHAVLISGLRSTACQGGFALSASHSFGSSTLDC